MWILAFWEQENSVSIHSQSELCNGSQGVSVGGLCSVRFGKKVYEGAIAGVIPTKAKVGINQLAST